MGASAGDIGLDCALVATVFVALVGNEYGTADVSIVKIVWTSVWNAVGIWMLAKAASRSEVDGGAASPLFNDGRKCNKLSR